ncbi:MAG: hypothetical protein WCB19_04375, partial [Thermoplasmata archaeon]
MLPRLNHAHSGWQLPLAVLVLAALLLGSVTGLAAATPEPPGPTATPSAAATVATPTSNQAPVPQG